jgi:hypothetical protein
MSYLNKIVLELHNCLHELEPEDEVPMVWSREFQQRLAQNANHWNDEQRRASHVSDMDFQDAQDSDIVIPYDDDDHPEVTSEFDIDLGVGFEQEEETAGSFKTNWGPAFRKYLNAEDEPAKEEMPLLKNMVKDEEEEEEGDDEFNITTDPEKVEKAKRLRDRALEVRDKARAARDKAKSQNAEPGEAHEVDDAEGEIGEFGDEGSDEWEDPDKQGVIRTIPNAHLVHKRQQEDGTFDELWIFNILDDFKKELKIRRAILAGTDIPINKMRSPDGSQTYELWTVGNGQMLKIQGLPN